jgi:hypothetical protein
MPDIINNVTNKIIPSKGHNIYVVPFIDVNSSIYSDNLLGNLSYGGSLSLGGKGVNKNRSRTYAHIWDLYEISNSVKNGSLWGYFTINFENGSKFKPLFCESFNDNGGDSVYKQLPNFTGLSIHNYPSFSEQKYSASFSFSPIKAITKNNIQYPGERAIWRASVTPLFPMFVCSSITTHKSFGPAFLSSFNISVDGRNSLGQVQIQCSLVGGKALITPTDVKVTTYPYKPLTDDKYFSNKIVKMTKLDNLSTITEPVIDGTQFDFDFVNKYRNLNLSDCGVDINFGNSVFTDINSFWNSVRSKWSNNKVVPDAKIVEMSLSISQNIDFTFSQPFYNGSYVSDIYGPRYASLSNRQVSGSITYFSFFSDALFANTTNLVMYFGNDFLYAMQNVDWSNPIVSINPDGGYFHQYKFIARFSNVTTFPQHGKPFSEFMNASIYE